MTSEVTGTGIPGEHNAHMPQDACASTGRRCSRGYCTFACTVGAARCRCPRCVDKEGAPTSRAVSKPRFTSNAFPGQGRSLVLDKPDTTACTHRTANAIPIRTSVNQNVIPRAAQQCTLLQKPVRCDIMSTNHQVFSVSFHFWHAMPSLLY